jgi:hypothetical protein
MDYTVQTLKFCDKTEKVNQGLKSQTHPYLPNGEGLWWVFHTIGFKKLENGGGRSSPNPKKKIAIGSKWPCNPKTRNLLYLPNPTLFGKNNSTTSFKTLENGGVGHFKTFKIYNNYP